MKDDPDDNEPTPYEMGFHYGRTGKSEDDNPFSEGTSSWGEWRLGWSDGDDEREESRVESQM
jgi:ribosome modulation factor